MQVKLPWNLELEQQILGALLIKDSLMFDLTEEIDADDFWDPGHQAIFRTIESLVFGGKRANAALIRDYLGAKEAKVKVDEAYLDSLTSAVASLTDTTHYARQVADLARRRRLITALMEGAGELGQLDPKVSSQSLIDKIETDILGASRVDTNSVRRLGEYAQRSVARVIDNIDRPTPQTAGFKWGLTAVQNVAGPLLPGKLVILGGRPGSGKSALAGMAAESFGEQSPGYVQSLEMEGEEWADRLMSHYADIAAWRIGVAGLNEAEVERLQDAATRLRQLPVWIDQKPRLTIDQIRARAIRYKHKYGIKWMIVDHIHLIRPASKKTDKIEAVSEIADELKQTAKSLGVGVLALAQLNRGVRDRDDGRPRASDLLYYSSIEPHADSIIFTHRPEIALGERKPDSSSSGSKLDEWEGKMRKAKGRAEIINAKRRQGESYLTSECLFDGPGMRFVDLQTKYTPVETAGELIARY